jgi:hypothetical protein
VDRRCFDADPDKDPTFTFDADLDPDPTPSLENHDYLCFYSEQSQFTWNGLKYR